MRAQIFKGYKGQLQPVTISHREQRSILNHKAGLNPNVHHNTLRVVIKNQKNAEAFASMISNA